MRTRLLPQNLIGLAGIWSVSMLLVGCQNGLQQNLQPPGTVWQQRNRAVQFDPYPIDHMGPAIVGGRPREFGKPLPEAYDNQLAPKRPR
ncbi:MAG: membrane or secreted protein [Pirellulaceae bacterium]|nr:membrane or secreted protein [Pirellulaceae bacterium]